MKELSDLLEEVRERAKHDAAKDLAETMVERSEDIWNALVEFCGENEAGLAVMCLFQEAAKCGVIKANKFKDDHSDDLEFFKIESADEGCTTIVGAGVYLEVFERK